MAKGFTVKASKPKKNKQDKIESGTMKQSKRDGEERR